MEQTYSTMKTQDLNIMIKRLIKCHSNSEQSILRLRNKKMIRM
ncbi:hypothetical protein T01_10891 [Trichinella spiralis]|uniref:Uncharacterized protein n=1 Tax=Trichinella spiralis TaxID=6334 RepID=A0A0V0YT02_TRISP|nr:hypothetical protein T01_10891 [Trichinella spiralis]